jgi:hypothetical protein
MVPSTFQLHDSRLVQKEHGTMSRYLVNNTHHKHGNLRGRTQRYSEGDVLLQSIIFY